jgi:hypothetical protein
MCNTSNCFADHSNIPEEATSISRNGGVSGRNNNPENTAEISQQGEIPCRSMTLKLKRWLEIAKDPYTTDRPISRYLREYPPLNLPFPGYAGDLSEAQANENLHYRLDIRFERLDLLRNLLYHTAPSIVWPDRFTRDNIDPFIIALHQWAGKQWPALKARIKGDVLSRWRTGERGGECIGLSIVADVGQVLGELILTLRPSLNWGIDRDPVNIRNGKDTVNRMVLLGDRRGDPGNQIEVDIEAIVLNRFLHPKEINERLENSWLRSIHAAINGGNEGAGALDDLPTDTHGIPTAEPKITRD